ncbi:MAG: hypothetical protein SFV24_00980, partial [Gemmatimonadales bacterium]|nr:hypothetical protein [Gemmatimonadales bacterium]
MDSQLASLAEFLFKYPARVFEQGTLVWQGAGLAWIVIPAAIGLGVLGVATYLRSRRGRLVDRVVLGLLRAVAVGLLGVAMLRPGLLLSISQPQQNILGIVLDDSKSMLIQDADSLTRLDRVRRLFDDSTSA